MVCTGNNIANCPKIPQFLPTKCTLCVLYALCTNALSVIVASATTLQIVAFCNGI